MLASLLRALLDTIYPPRCPSCRSYVAADGYFCRTCFEKLHLISAPYCAVCSIPFAVPMDEGARCPSCLETPPSYDRARAVMVYDAVSAPVISALKFADQWAGLSRHAEMMQAAGADLLASADLLVPVPLHWRRLWRRRFNQSALLAFALRRLSGLPCEVQALERRAHTVPQMQLARKDRLTNVRKAFGVTASVADKLVGKRVLLIDDVMTTGATVEACARALKRAGAAQVNVLVLARTVKE